MSWFISIGVAFITAILCGAGALWLSVHAVAWYQVSSFEGASGYAAVGLAILGTVAAAIIGFIAARIGVAFGWGSFGGQLLWALGSGLIALGLVAVISRALADVPPKLSGKELDLMIEIRFPPETVEQPKNVDGTAGLELGAMHPFKSVVRNRVTGSLAFDQARMEDGCWVLPGQVPVFTSRGKRLLMITLDGKNQGFFVPLPAYPGASDMSWSEWLPRKQSKPSPLLEQFS